MSSAWPARALAANSASAICPQTMTEAGAAEMLMTLNGAYRPPLAGLGAGLTGLGCTRWRRRRSARCWAA
jgi:hypothetical protein